MKKILIVFMCAMLFFTVVLPAQAWEWKKPWNWPLLNAPFAVADGIVTGVLSIFTTKGLAIINVPGNAGVAPINAWERFYGAFNPNYDQPMFVNSKNANSKLLRNIVGWTGAFAAFTPLIHAGNSMLFTGLRHTSDKVLLTGLTAGVLVTGIEYAATGTLTVAQASKISFAKNEIDQIKAETIAFLSNNGVDTTEMTKESPAPAMYSFLTNDI